MAAAKLSYKPQTTSHQQLNGRLTLSYRPLLILRNEQTSRRGIEEGTSFLILHISEAEVCGPHSLRLTFSDGTRKRVNLLPLLEGPIFEPLVDPA